MRGSARNSSGVSASRRVSASRIGPSRSMRLCRSDGGRIAGPFQRSRLELLEHMGTVAIVAARRARRRAHRREAPRQLLKRFPGVDLVERNGVVTGAEAAGRHARELVDEEKLLARPAVVDRDALTPCGRDEAPQITLRAAEPNAARFEILPYAQ